MFTTVMQVCIIVMSVSLLVSLAAVILTKDELSRAVMAVSYTHLTLPTKRIV